MWTNTGTLQYRAPETLDRTQSNSFKPAVKTS